MGTKRPFTVEVTGDTKLRTYASEVAALGAALADLSHMPIGSEAWVNERWLSGERHTHVVMKRLPNFTVHVRLEWIAKGPDGGPPQGSGDSGT